MTPIMIRAMASLIRNYSAPTFHLYKQKPALSGAERIGKGSRYFLVGPLCAKAETIASNASIAKSIATTSSAFCTSRALMLVAVAAAAATFGVDHAKASKLRALKQRRERCPDVSRPAMMNLEDSLRARPTKASESRHLKRSFSSPPVASAHASRGRRCGGDL